MKLILLINVIMPTNVDILKVMSRKILDMRVLSGILIGLVKKLKGALSWYGKLTWESAHAWNLIILCLLIVWGMTFIFMVHLSFYAIPLLIYDVMYDITTIP